VYAVRTFVMCSACVVYICELDLHRVCVSVDGDYVAFEDFSIGYEMFVIVCACVTFSVR
jgi:hypothetical protein